MSSGRIDELFAFVTPHDDGFAERARGAAPELIARFEALVDRELPADYRGYLERLGADDAGLRVAVDATTDLDEIVEYYEEETASGELAVPPNCVVIAVAGVAFDTLCLEWSGARDEPQVVITEGRRIVKLHAESFGALMFRTAFERYRIPSAPWVARYRGTDRERATDAARERAAEAGLAVAWYSDRVVVCAEQPVNGVALTATQFRNSEMIINIAGPNRVAVEAVGEAVALELPTMTFDAWFRHGAEGAA